MDNRRRQYRVTAEFDRLVQVELLGPKVHATNVRMLDLSAGGAGIVLPSRASGVLRMRDRIELRLISAALSEPVRMFAQACSWSAMCRRRRVRVPDVQGRLTHCYLLTFGSR